MVLPDGVHNLRGYVKPPTPDIQATLKPGGKYAGLRTGPWPAKPQHIIEVEKKEAAERASRDQEAGGKKSGPAVADQVLQLNNELFMTSEALFRWGWLHAWFQGQATALTISPTAGTAGDAHAVSCAHGVCDIWGAAIPCSSAKPSYIVSGCL